MPVLAAVAMVTRRRALLKVVCAAIAAVFLAGLMAFVGGVAVLTGITGQRAFACAPSGVDASIAVDGTSAGLEIRNAGQLPYVLTPRQESVARTYIAVGKQLALPRSG